MKMKMNKTKNTTEPTCEDVRAIALTFGAFTFNGALEDLAPTIEIVKNDLMPLMERSTKIMSQYMNPALNDESRRWE